MSLSADVNGLQLFYRDSGSGDPLLLLHGFTGSGDDWKHVFSDPIQGHRVIVPDLRGHGRSTNPGGVFKFADRRARYLRAARSYRHRSVKAIGMSAGANTLLAHGHQAAAIGSSQ
jgi:pimeloyl-ACP methyl ester carboxylesterase